MSKHHLSKHHLSKHHLTRAVGPGGPVGAEGWSGWVLGLILLLGVGIGFGVPRWADGAEPVGVDVDAEAVEGVLGREEDRTGVRFRAGLAALAEAEAATDWAIRTGHLDTAIAAFQEILVSRPELVRVRLELARAFFLKREDARARRQFEQVLAGEVPEAVEVNVQRFLRILRARRRWEAWFGAALAPDSNLNAASGERTIFLDTVVGRLPFTRQGDIGPESGLGLSLWGGGEYQHPLTVRRRLRLGANASVREYRGRGFDRQFLALHLGPRWLLDARTEASVLTTVDRQWSGGRPDSDRVGLRLEAERRLTPRLALSAQVRAVRRRCRGCGYLDGPEGGLDVEVHWVVRPTLRLVGELGWDRSRAAAEHWRSRGPRVSLGGTVALRAGVTLGLRVGLGRTDYEGSGAAHYTLDRRSRRDETRTFTVSVHHRGLTLRGFSPRLSLTREVRRTNAQALDYDRDRAELSFVRPF